MPTRNVVLTDRQESLIEALVQSGRYQNAGDVLREGLRLIEDREVEEARKLEALRAAVQLGERAVESGDYQDFADPAGLLTGLNRLSDRSARRTETK
jgi:antitoxin ParD1/3/4